MEGMMEFDLYDFDEVVDDVIVGRGAEYFVNGRVKKVKELEDGCYQARVKGNETYTVYIELDGDDVTGFNCDCPYDQGPVCKHVVAVLYYLQEELEEEDLWEDEDDELYDDGDGIPVNEPDSELLDHILQKLNTNELRSIIREQSEIDDRFLNTLIARYASRVLSVSKEFYTRQIAAVFDSFISDQGYIPYSRTNEFLAALNVIEENAIKELEKGNYQHVFYIIMAIEEEISEKLYYVDDSSGIIGGFLTFGSELLTDLAEKELSEELRKELFKYAVQVLKPEKFQGFDWNYTRIYTAIALMETKEEKEQLRKAFNKMIASPEVSTYIKESLEEVFVNFITLADGEDAALHYMECKVENRDFRKKLIEKAIEATDYEKALCLAEEGVKRDEKEAPGLVDSWRRYQLDIYQKLDDKENTLRLARYLYLHAGRWNKEPDYYQLLKQLIPAAEWTAYVEDLINEVKEKHRSDYDLLADIYIRESRWKDFLELVYNWPSFYRIEHAEKYMANIYPVDLADLYRECILADLERTSDRSHYQQMCQYIKRIIKLGAKKQALQLIEQLKKLYPRRKAMIEELNDVMKLVSVKDSRPG